MIPDHFASLMSGNAGGGSASHRWPDEGRGLAWWWGEDDAVVDHAGGAGCDELQRVRIEFVLGFEDARGERVSGVIRHDRNGRLRDDGA